MKHKSILYLALASCIFTMSCTNKKGCGDPSCINYDPTGEGDNSKCIYAGPGGNTSIKATVTHKGRWLIGRDDYPDSAFIKFNTQESPGTNASDYDLVLGGEGGEDHVHIDGMKPGKYYIMMTGFENKRVIGGAPCIVKEDAGEEVGVLVPVD